MNDPIEEAKRLFAYLNGELNEEENRKMEEQIRQDERLQELVVQLRDKDYITRELTAMRHYDTAAAKAKVKERAGMNVTASAASDRKHNFRNLLLMAASLLVIVIAGAWWYADTAKVTPPTLSQEVKQAMEKSFQQERNIAEVLDAGEPIAQKKNAADIRKLDLTEEAAEELLAARRVTTYHDKEFWMTLPDGTVVHLNYDSHLIYPEKFHGDYREVILSGDAYFLVAKDERHPFVVHTLQGDICDYGTEFYVESVKNTGAVNVVLVSGKVGVKPRNGAEQLMKPSEKASLLNNQVSMEKTDVSPYVAWNTGSFVFVDCRLDKLMNVLSGWNNVKVSFANEKMKEIRFTGNIDKYSGLEHALEALSDVTGLRFTQKGNLVTVEP